MAIRLSRIALSCSSEIIPQPTCILSKATKEIRENIKSRLKMRVEKGGQGLSFRKWYGLLWLRLIDHEILLIFITSPSIQCRSEFAHKIVQQNLWLMDYKWDKNKIKKIMYYLYLCRHLYRVYVVYIASKQEF